MRILFPIILTIAAIGLFVVYTNPTYQASKLLAAQVDAYNVALDKSKDLREERDKLLSKRNTFSPDNIQKLQELLPDNVDSIRFVIDINNIASRHGLLVKDVQLGDISANSKQIATGGIGAPAGAVSSIDITFSVTASYENMLAFIQDVEHSLRVIDIKELNFSVSDTASTYSFTVRTYWLN